jgi:hypothetical protein
MSAWFTVVVRVASVEGITDSAYTNALYMFAEGERTTPPPEDECWTSCYIALYGQLLQQPMVFSPMSLAILLPHTPVVYRYQRYIVSLADPSYSNSYSTTSIASTE